MLYIINRIKKMNIKKLLIMIVSTVVAIGVIVGAYFLIAKPFEAKYDGEITVEVLDLEGDTIKSKKIGFKEGDTLVALVEANFDNVLIENGMIMNIEDYVTPSDWSTFLSIYVDNEMSMVGILEIVFKDGTLITFRITEYIPM